MNGDEAQGIVALARESFSTSNLVEVENRAFDQPITFDQALAEMNVQISVRQSRLHRYFARKEAEGTPLPDEAKAALMQRERDAVEQASSSATAATTSSSTRTRSTASSRS
jgi:hypothetical protein